MGSLLSVQRTQMKNKVMTASKLINVYGLSILVICFVLCTYQCNAPVPPYVGPYCVREGGSGALQYIDRCITCMGVSGPSLLIESIDSMIIMKYRIYSNSSCGYY